MDEKTWIEYLPLYCKNELTAEQYAGLKQWVEAKEENRRIFEQLLRTYRHGRRGACAARIDEAEAWQKIAGQLTETRKRGKRLPMRWLKYAAVVLMAVGIGMYSVYISPLEKEQPINRILPGSQKAILRLSDGREFRLQQNTDCVLTEKNGARIEIGGEDRLAYRAGDSARMEVLYNTIIVPRGGEYSLLLADGSRVWLNAGSELTYPIVFGGEERRLKLKGEAFFEVASDSLRPFIVESRYNRVEVLGTRFNVSAYEEYDQVKTTLLRGSVRVSNLHRQQILVPGQQAVCGADRMEVRRVDAASVAAWVQGTFEFENMPLGEITDQLGRWYDVDFVYHQPALREITFTGAATRYREPEFILAMIEQLAEVKFIVEGRTIQVVAK